MATLGRPVHIVTTAIGWPEPSVRMMPLPAASAISPWTYTLAMPTQARRIAARHVVTRHRPVDLEDVEHLIDLGKLEFGR